MTIKILFYHILHFIGIGKFYIAEIRKPNFTTNITTIETIEGYCYNNNVEKYINNIIIKNYGTLGLYFFTVNIKKIW